MNTISTPWYRRVCKTDLARGFLVACFALCLITSVLYAAADVVLHADEAFVYVAEVILFGLGAAVAVVFMHFNSRRCPLLRANKHVLRTTAARRNVAIGEARYSIERDNLWLRDRWVIYDRRREDVVPDETAERWINIYCG